MSMNLKTFEVRNTTTKTARSTALVFLAAAFLSLPLHGQESSGTDRVGASATDSAHADQAIPAAVMKDLEEMKKRIAHREAQLQKRDAQPVTLSAAEGTEPAFQGPNAPEVHLAAASCAQPSIAQPQSETAGAAPTKKQKVEPFSDWDWTWLNGNPRNKDVAFDSKFFTPEIRADVTYTYDFNKPIDNSIGGSSEIFRSNEIQLEQLGLGGDFHYDNVRARFMTQFGMYSTTTVRNDPSYAKGQWNINEAHRYLSEDYAEFHINALNGT